MLLAVAIAAAAATGHASGGRKAPLPSAREVCDFEDDVAAWLVCRWEGEMPLSKEMRVDYETKFATAEVDPERRAEVEQIITRMMRDRARYEAVSAKTGVPWYVIAVIHQMEREGDFRCHLHNGDPLRARTVQEPKGRPVAGRPPFAWDVSAIDALGYQGFDAWHDWTAGGMLYKIEAFNGFGYRSRGIASPYLFSATQHYSRGKYTSDGHFNPDAVSDQIGAAAILRRMADQALIEIPKGTAN